MRRGRAGRLLVGLAALAGAGALALEAWIRGAPLPPLSVETSPVALDAEGELLRAWQIGEGTWRLPVTAAAVDPGYLCLLMAYEDRRFEDHPGVDPLALLRAARQGVQAGRVVSGGSTLTMQVARLLEGSGTGTLAGKLAQIRLALALERRLSKREILEIYLHRAPFGGNIEGVRAAALLWLGKEPARLTPAESALLVALPQSPEARRPDRHPEAARRARDRVLARAVAAGALGTEAAAAARSEPVPIARRAVPSLAPHLTDRLRRETPGAGVLRTTLDGRLQAALEALLDDRLPRLEPGLSAAILVADHRTGRVRAAIGAADPHDPARRGFVDMTRAVRSPGSLLKPLVYGLAFEAGIAHPETLLEDRPRRFGDYAPQNFDRQFRGTVSLREALALSLNLPAVTLAEAVGPATIAARLRRGGAEPRLQGGAAPGLAMVLGGVGLTLEELVALYGALARGGHPLALEARAPAEARARGAPVLSRAAAWQVGDVLSGIAPPLGSPRLGIAYKTGTSYGHRDAWAIGYDGAHVVGVWLGRPDGTPAPGARGLDLAAPLLFETFARIGRSTPLPPPPPETLTVGAAGLPPPLRRFGGEEASPEGAPEIAFPPDGARLARAAGTDRALIAKARGGRRPYHWLVDGAPVAVGAFDREIAVPLAGAGFHVITLIDATGASSRSTVFVD